MDDLLHPDELLAYLRTTAAAHEQMREASDKAARAARRLERALERRLQEREASVVESAT